MKKILFVEDDPMIVRIYRGKFQSQGYEVDIAADGECALASLKARIPDLVLLDLQLPKVSGVEVLKFIRAQPHLKALPVIVFSNAFLGKLVEEAWQAGATTCLTKAKCTPDQLLDTIKAGLENKLPPPRSSSLEMPSSATRILHQDEKSSAIIPASAALTDLAREANAWAASRSNQPVVARPSKLEVAPAPSPRPAAPAAGSSDPGSQSLIRELFLSACPHILSTLRAQIVSLNNAEDAPRRQREMQAMLKSVHSLTGNAGLAGFERIAQIASAQEALLKELHEKSQEVSVSILRTISGAVDSLEQLIASAPDSAGRESSSPLALVVDADRVCGRAVCSALAHAGVRAISFSDLETGLAAVEQNPFDIILLGLNVPKAEGLNFLGRMRAVAARPATPVILLAPSEHFEDYALSATDAQCEVMAKPFLLIEITVKTLSTLTRGETEVPLARTA